MKFFGGVRLVNRPCMENVRRLDMGVLPVVAKMQRKGVMIDRGHFAALSVRLAQDMERIREEIKTLSGKYINPDSSDQVALLLFGDKGLGLKAPAHLKKVASGKRYSIDDEALESMKNLHPVVPRVQDYRERSKLKNSYVDVLPIIADENDRVHTTLRVTRQETGRISSSSPNLMAQPTRTELGREVRNGFIAPKGRKLGTIDQSQIEMRVAAHEAQCSAMIETFRRGGDIHTETASRIFKLPVEKLDKMRHRYPAKRIGFGVLFGITEEGLRDQIVVASDPKWTEEDRQAYIAEWPLEACARTIREWFAVYFEIRSLMHLYHSRVRRFGFGWDMWGRIRHIPEVRSVHKHIVEAGLRKAGNMPVQSGAQGCMKIFMAEADAYVESCRMPIDPLLQIHDEELFEGDAGVMDDCMGQLGEIMGSCVQLSVPIKYGVATGERWGELEK